MDSNNILHLVGPPPLRYRALLLCGLMVIMLGLILVRNSGNLFAMKLTSVVTLLVMALIFLFAGSIIYRNLFFRDELFIVKNSATVPPGAIAITADDLVSIEVQKSPAPFSYDEKMAMLGLNQGILLIHTRTGEIHFGTGLSVRDAHEVKKKIMDFCGSDIRAA